MPENDRDAALETVNAISLMMGDKLKELLGRKSRIDCREFRRIIPEGLDQELPRSLVLVEELREGNGKEVHNLYAFDKDTVSRLTNYIMGFEPEAYNPLDEVAMSTFREVISQCIRIEEQETETLLKVKVKGRLGEITQSENLSELEQKFKSWNDGMLLLVRYGLEVEDVLKTEFYKITTDGFFFSVGDWNQKEEERRAELAEKTPRKKRSIAVRTVTFPEFKVEDIENTVQGIGEERTRLRDISLGVSVQIGRASCRVKDILALKEGQVLTLNKQAGAPADIVVNGVLVGRGDVLVSNDSFAARITEIIGKKE